jgi:HAE1 family hydrophobic/amphiphilic exporter-1
MLTVPLAVLGGFLGLAVVHEYTWRDPTVAVQELDMLSILGFVILLGTVVNNGILIVHQALNYMRYGQSNADAIVESVRTRIRPILMTVITTLVGLIPLVIRPGAGAELYRGLGAVVLGGLTLSTVFTLLVIPAMLSLFVSGRGWVVRQVRSTTALPAGTDVLIAPGFARAAMAVADIPVTDRSVPLADTVPAGPSTAPTAAPPRE